MPNNLYVLCHRLIEIHDKNYTENNINVGLDNKKIPEY